LIRPACRLGVDRRSKRISAIGPRTDAPRILDHRLSVQTAGAYVPSSPGTLSVMDDGTTDDIKGRLKEAGGDLTGDKDLKNEGRVDRASGKTKEAVGDAADKVKDALRKD
jgi:uncharacterized protein YjbJ (UPF0337 family)